MRMVGASVSLPSPLCAELADALRTGRPILLWSDGCDSSALIGEDGETPSDLMSLAKLLLPEFQS